MSKRNDAPLVSAILFMAVVTWMLGKAAVQGEQQQQQPRAA